MGLFGKKVLDPKEVEMNEILAQSLINSKVPEGVDKDFYDLIGLIVSQCNMYAEEMQKHMGFIGPNQVIAFIRKEYKWIDKENLKRLGDRAVNRLK